MDGPFCYQDFGVHGPFYVFYKRAQFAKEDLHIFLSVFSKALVFSLSEPRTRLQFLGY